MEKGLIIKNISDSYTVLIGSEQIECIPRGKMRNNKQIPLVGDFVLVDKNTKTIEEILPRKNELLRPKVANITKGFIVTSCKHPNFDNNLLDKLLVELEINHIKPVILVTKKDLLTKDEFREIETILDYYSSIGYKVLYNTEINKIKKELENNISVFMGQTGAGKSTMLNKIFKDLNLETKEISLALGRGRHTTRHVEIIIKNNIKVLDTPGFSAISFLSFNEKNVLDAFIEFKKYGCKYIDCYHLKELECNVKKAVVEGRILKSRYENYQSIMNEFKNKTKW